jgi:hypothetical protein
LFSFDTELDGADAAHRIDNLDDGTTLAVASMFELFGEIVLVQGIGLDFVNTTVKILDLRPALSLRDDSIAGQYLLRPLFYSRCLVAQDERDPNARNKAYSAGHSFTTTANW